MSHPAAAPKHPSTAVHSHKHTIEQFADAIHGNHVANLDKFLDANVQKTVDTKVVYKDLKEAREYYTKEHADKKGAHWKIVHVHDDDQKGNTIQARLTYDNKTYTTTYTFASSGKIQRIDAVLEANQSTTTAGASAPTVHA